MGHLLGMRFGGVQDSKAMGRSNWQLDHLSRGFPWASETALNSPIVEALIPA